MIERELQKLKDPVKAKLLQGFFKTGPGEYGEGDFFLGITVPEQRKIAKKYAGLKLEEVGKLLHSKIHEYRLTALIILTLQYPRVDEKGKKEIFDFYLRNTKWINNWDLVDVTTPRIVGEYLLDNDRTVLYTLAKSTDLWERRIAILATYTFIQQNDFQDTLKISKLLLKDKQDLIHKAVGWMLREVGKKDLKTLEKFLQQHYRKMPRTMLRYAIEKFPEKKRKDYLKNVV